MKSDSQDFNPRRQKAVEDPISDTPLFANHPQEQEMLFELLSAYIDGEAEVSDRRQVQELLDNDPQVNRSYNRLLRVQQSMRQMPSPCPSPSSNELAEQIFQRVDRQRQGRLFMFGGAVIATLLLGAVSTFFLKNDSLMPKFAHKQEQGLMIALNHPVVDIPTISTTGEQDTQK